MRKLKKYPNRRLYDLTASRYITLDDARALLLGGESIQVLDSTDGSDITRVVLLQILVELEAQPRHAVLTEPVIERIIRAHGSGEHVSHRIEQSIFDALERDGGPSGPDADDGEQLES